jgi:hypothetical protein
MATKTSAAIRGDSVGLYIEGGPGTGYVELTSMAGNLYHPTNENTWVSGIAYGGAVTGESWKIYNWLWSYPTGVTWSDIISINFEFEGKQNDGSPTDDVEFGLQLLENSASGSGGGKSITKYASLLGDNDFTYRSYSISETPASWNIDQTEFEDLIAGNLCWRTVTSWDHFVDDALHIKGLYMTITYNAPDSSGIFGGYGSF